MNVSSSVDFAYCDNAEIMEITNIFKRYGFAWDLYSGIIL